MLNLTAAFIKQSRTSGLIERESSLLRCCVYNYQKLYLHLVSLLHIKRTLLFIHVAPGSYADSRYIQVMMACSYVVSNFLFVFPALLCRQRAACVREDDAWVGGVANT